VLEIDGASNRGIDEIRNLRERVRYAPVQGRHKIYIIDEVHMLTPEAFNALLKTLEEPPPQVLFIFATTEPNKLLPTILSRCQRFDFRKISVKEIVQRLKYISEQEGISTEDDACLLIAKKADGSVRDAESMLDQAASFSEDNVTEADLRTVLGFVPKDLLFELTDCFSRHDPKAALLIIDKVVEEGHDPREFVLELVEHLRTLLLLKMDLRLAELQGIPEAEMKKYEAQTDQFDSGQILRMLSLTTQLEPRLHRSVQPRTLLDTHVVQLSRLDSTVMLETLLKKIEETGQDHTPRPQPRKETADLEGILSSLADKVKEKKKLLGAALTFGSPESLTEDEFILAFDKKHKFQMESILSPEAKEAVEAELALILGRKVNLLCVLERPRGRREKRRKKRPEEDETVKHVMETFDAEIIDVNDP
jgi:DNA polymerase-3 subunit gamma/tau